MARTTAAAVKAIMKTNVTEAQITPFVTDANNFVTATLGTSGLGSDLLASIEKWVCAHMVASTLDRQISEGKGGSASAKFSGQYGANLSSTSYGQTAMVLDTTGTLASMGGRAVQIHAVPSFDS